jgi:hypothetical protein
VSGSARLASIDVRTMFSALLERFVEMHSVAE